MAKRQWMAALLIGLSGSSAAYAGTIGDFTGTSTPTVITPQMTPAPQTPAYPPPRIGADAGFIYLPAPRAHMHRHSGAPVTPHAQIR
jgi:hypothetical protein